MNQNTQTTKKEKSPASLEDMTNCIVLEDLTPRKPLNVKTYLCECKLCGTRFVRSRRTLISKYSDCGCLSRKSYSNVKLVDYEIRHLDDLSKKILQIKIDAIGNTSLSAAFKVLYIQNKQMTEFNALNYAFMSFSSFYRARLAIVKLWPTLRNDFMK